jgi:hypothetical protein
MRQSERQRRLGIRSRPVMRRPTRLAASLGVLLTFAGCFESPVAESLLLTFLAEGGVTVTATIEIQAAEDSNPAVRRRLEETRQQVLDGQDDWSRRLAALRPVHERTEIEKIDGKIHRAAWSGTTEDAEGLRRFFSDTGVQADWNPTDLGGELRLLAGVSGRATRHERQEVERALAAWSTAIGEYIGASAKLFDYVDRHPDRARTCLGALFEGSLSEEDAESLEEPTPEESELIEAVSQAMEAVTKVLLVSPGEAYSLDEKSRRVYDPFPAPVAVRVPGEILELEGFASTAAGELRVRELGLWSALRSLEGVWLTPDPLLAIVEHDLRRDSQRSFALEDWLSQDRHVTSEPAAAEIEHRIKQALEPEPSYRVSWSTGNLSR